MHSKAGMIKKDECTDAKWLGKLIIPGIGDRDCCSAMFPFPIFQDDHGHDDFDNGEPHDHDLDDYDDIICICWHVGCGGQFYRNIARVNLGPCHFISAVEWFISATI